MSEQSPRSNPRLDNFESNKKASERAAFEEALYAEAGSTDFSDDAKRRVEEADAYERHMEALANNTSDTVNWNTDWNASKDLDLESQPSPGYEKEWNDAVEQHRNSKAEAEAKEADIVSKMAADVRVRQMAGIAASIAEINATQVTADNEARLTQALADKQDRLQDLLVKFSDTSELSAEDKDVIIGRIIDMTERQQAEAVSEAEQSEDIEEATNDIRVTPWEPPVMTEEQIARKQAAVEKVKQEMAETPVSVDEMIDEAKARLDENARAMESEANAKRNSTEQAQADRQLLEELPADDEIAEVAGSQSTEVVSELPEDDEVARAANGETEQSEDEVESERRSWRKRMRDFFTPAGLAAEIKAATYKGKEKLGRHPKAKVALGVLAVGGVIGAYYIMKDNGASALDAATTKAGGPKNGETAASLMDKAHELFGNGSVDVRPGDGFTQVLDRVLDTHDVHLNAKELLDLHTHLENTQGDYIDIQGVNDTYTMTDGTSGLSRPDAQANVSEQTQKAVVRWLQNRGKLA
jgi:hypothetical protein